MRARLCFEMFPRGNVGSLGTKKIQILHSVALIVETPCNLPRDENSQLAQANTITVVETFNFGNPSNGLSCLFHTNSHHVACGRSLLSTVWVCHTTLKAFSLPWNEWQTKKELWNELMFSNKCSELAMGINWKANAFKYALGVSITVGCGAVAPVCRFRHLSGRLSVQSIHATQCQVILVPFTVLGFGQRGLLPTWRLFRLLKKSRMCIILPFFLLVMVMLVMPRVIWRMWLMTFRMKMVLRLLENLRSTTALTKSRKMETSTLILNLLANVFRGQDTPRWRKRASFDVPLDDSGLQTYLEEEFPTSPHSLHFAFGVKSSNLPSWITSWNKPTCMHTATAIFPAFSTKIFRPSLASFCCLAIIIFPMKTIIGQLWRSRLPNCFKGK